MSIRRIRCPECDSTQLNTIEVLATAQGFYGLRDRVRFKCDDCTHEWEGVRANAEALAKARRRGIRI